MDLKVYFRKMREIEASLMEPFPVLVSLETPDGGKPGMYCEASRTNAARMIAEGRSALASPEQVAEYRLQQAAAREAFDRAEMAKRIQVAIVTDSNLTGDVTDRRGGSTPNRK